VTGTEARTVPGRGSFPWFHAIATRWMDNDIYGHVNNAHYYSYFDTAVNQYLIDEGGLEIHAAPVIGVCVESKCTYRQPLVHPETVQVGVRTEHLGNRSVRYGIGIFREGEDEPAAWGYFVHVFVERDTMRPAPIPDALRAALSDLAGSFPLA